MKRCYYGDQRQASGCTLAQAMPSVVRKDPDPANLCPKNSAVVRKSRCALLSEIETMQMSSIAGGQLHYLENVSITPCGYLYIVSAWPILRERSLLQKHVGYVSSQENILPCTLCLYKTISNGNTLNKALPQGTSLSLGWSDVEESRLSAR